MSITALIHTRNEAVNLPDCLRSVAWADEIVVADMASTDTTRELAVAQGARVIDMPLAPIVEPVRNLAVAQCAGEWVLIVDADERISPKLAGQLRAISRDGTATASAYALPRRNYFMGEWLEFGCWPDSQIRFIRKGTTFWNDQVHQPPQVKGTLIELPADPAAAIEHLFVGHELSRLIEKGTRYTVLDAQRLAANLRPPIWPYLLRRPLSEFYGRYILDQAWRHGMRGLVWSLISAQYQLLVAIHYWALVQAPQPDPCTPATLRRRVSWEGIRTGLKWLRLKSR